MGDADRIGTALPTAAPVTGFLTMPERAERCDTTASLVDRLGTPGLKGARRARLLRRAAAPRGSGAAR